MGHEPRPGEVKGARLRRLIRGGLSRRPGRNPLERRADGSPAQIVLVLEIDPELRGQPEIDAQPQGRIGGNRPLAAHNIPHARRGYRQIRPGGPEEERPKLSPTHSGDRIQSGAS